MNTRTSSRARQAGLGLLEVVIAVLILGLLAVAAWKFQHGVVLQTRYEADQMLVQRADRSIRAFMARQSRLPCPAADAGGTESCRTGMAAAPGFVPWRTLGLPDAGAGSLRYALAADALAQAAPGIETLQIPDRQLQQILVSGDVGNATLPWCNVLGLRMKQVGAEMAYRVFSGGAGPLARVDAAPLDAAGAGVLRLLPELWTELHCGDLIAGAGRAHMNAALAARMMRISADEQLLLAGKNTDAAHASYDYAVVDLVTEILRQPSRLANAGVACTSAASMTADIVAGTATPEQYWGVAGAAASCITGGLDVAIHIAYLVEKVEALQQQAKALGVQADNVLQLRQAEADQAAALEAGIAARARAAVASGIHLQ
ncbi:type II secretion system protein [Pseudacidovorax sp. RU35E]|uniref:type II secretion system protein n=1 Tax=Pseudacidovorax sp. RU35E TaxID=1907403 RepID=UPI0009542885|nr:prepilin-type N-terminal cleavage/methylation domain-containing protein [Pseudacidovorax sp. RU35E]SIR73039.1 hypothetical protein SAMN05880557_11823 [Pseudacidovorax sp. RU35E]